MAENHDFWDDEAYKDQRDEHGYFREKMPGKDNIPEHAEPKFLKPKYSKFVDDHYDGKDVHGTELIKNMYGSNLNDHNLKNYLRAYSEIEELLVTEIGNPNETIYDMLEESPENSSLRMACMGYVSGYNNNLRQEIFDNYNKKDYMKIMNTLDKSDLALNLLQRFGAKKEYVSVILKSNSDRRKEIIREWENPVTDDLLEKMRSFSDKQQYEIADEVKGCIKEIRDHIGQGNHKEAEQLAEHYKEQFNKFWR